jgi:dTDP-3-amino-3,4,6-trideoxy-alpha-D-glucopyranose N,N-dimethyltransferase
VTGVDLDPAMLDQARALLPDTRLVEADMCDLDLGTTFDVVICLFSSIGYLTDTGQLDAAIKSMAAQMNPDALLIVDGWVRPDAWMDGGHVSLDVAVSDPEVQVVRACRSERVGARTNLEMHYLIATSAGIEHVVEQHRLTLFEPESYESAFRQAGLEVEVVPSPMPGRDRYIGWFGAAAR